MRLTRHGTDATPRWAADGQYLAEGTTLAQLLTLPASGIAGAVRALSTEERADAPALAPIDADQELWASGVTYLRSRDARKEESDVGASLYEHVYDADRPELFFKAIGRRVVGSGAPIRVRADSPWNVPEPELTLVINARAEIVGFTAGNDVSSRTIEGENALYLPQAKVYDGSAAIGPTIRLAPESEIAEVPIVLEIEREGRTVFSGETSTGAMKRGLAELARWLFAELSFPHGALLMTGTGIVPGDGFTLTAGDTVHITVDDIRLTNTVA